MRPVLRLREDLVAAVRADLGRPHEFAMERVGFIFGVTVRLGEGTDLVLGHSYESVADEDYLDRPTAAATIGSRAIRRAMQRALDVGDSVIHVHLHGLWANPSSVDLRTYSELLPSFQAVAPLSAHAGLVLGDDDATCVLLPPGSRQSVRSRVTIVGAPLRLWGTHDGD